MTIELTTLSNGLRIITDRVTSVDSVAVGIWVDVGARHEDSERNGISHMVEHMMFKGTPTRTALQIVEQVENVGGHINAYTSREVTAYHIHLLKDHLPLAFEILADIVQNPTMPDAELEQERHVILQEIGMTADTPDDLVFDHYQEVAYPGQALGAPILGRSEIVSAMDRDTLLDHVRCFYTPSRLVVSVSGNMKHEDVIKQAEKLFATMDADSGQDNYPEASYQGGVHRAGKDLEQAHIVLGFQGVSRADDDYYASVALATVLGGGMSSRLFQEVREKRGLVYSIFSFHIAYQDDGQLAIYAGTGPKDLPELVPVVCDEIKRIAQEEISEEELARVHSQMKASLLMSRESMMARAGQQAKYLIHFRELIDIDERLHAMEAVTREDIRRVAARIFATKPTLAALGPIDKLEDFDGIVQRLAA